MPIPAPIGIFDRFLIIALLADEAGIEDALTIDMIAPLYNAADPTPRTQTHIYTAFKATEAKRLEINSIEAGFPNSYFEKYDGKTQRTYASDRLLALGLTTDPGNI